MHHWTSAALSIQSSADTLWESNSYTIKSMLQQEIAPSNSADTHHPRVVGIAPGYSADFSPALTRWPLPSTVGCTQSWISLLTLIKHCTIFYCPKILQRFRSWPSQSLHEAHPSRIYKLRHGSLLTWSKCFTDHRVNKVVSWLICLYLDSYPSARKSNLIKLLKQAVRDAGFDCLHKINYAG